MNLKKLELKLFFFKQIKNLNWSLVLSNRTSLGIKGGIKDVSICVSQLVESQDPQFFPYHKVKLPFPFK